MLFPSMLLLLLTVLSLTQAIPFPGPNPTVGYKAADTNPRPTSTSTVSSGLALRSFATDAAVCGWIGGNGSLPATCSSGSTCVYDSVNKVVGCCPSGGSCTAGIYTGCVDAESPLQTAYSPNIVTCYGQAVCYQNSYPGGYHQYGCGYSSDATTVETTYSGQDPAFTLQIVRTGVTLTGSSTSFTGFVKPEISTHSISSISMSATSTSTSLSNSTGIGGQAALNPTESGIAISGQGNQVKTGLIIGCVIGGIGCIFALLAIGIFLIRRHQSVKEPHVYQFPPVEKRSSDSSIASSASFSHTRGVTSTLDRTASPVHHFLYSEGFLNDPAALTEPRQEREISPEWPLPQYSQANYYPAGSIEDTTDLPPTWNRPTTPPIPPRSLKRKSLPPGSLVYQHSHHRSGAVEQDRQLTTLRPSNSVATVSSSVYSCAIDGQSYVEHDSNARCSRIVEEIPPPPQLENHGQYGWYRVPTRMVKKVTDDHVGFHIATDPNTEQNRDLTQSAPPPAERTPSPSFSWSSEDTIFGWGVRLDEKRVRTANMNESHAEDEGEKVAPLRLTLRPVNAVEKAGGRPVPILGSPRVPSLGERERRLYQVY